MTGFSVLNARPAGPRHSPSIEEHVLNSEEQCRCRLHRLASYGEWPHLRTHSASAFTDAGFYYEGRDDYVKCTSCGLTLAQWTSGVHPLIAHRTLCTGACQFLGHRDPANIVPHGRGDGHALQHSQRLTSRAQEAGGGRWAGANEDERGTLLAADDTEAPAATASQRDNLFVASFCKSFVNLPLPPCIDLTGLLKIPTANEQASSLPLSEGNRENQLALPRLREDALKYETFRLSTFVGVWEYSSIIDPRELARAAFYYAGPRDRVQCAFCQGLLRNWEPGDRAMLLHAQHFTYCRFVQGHDVGNVPVPFSALEQSWPKHEGAVVEEVLGVSRSTPQNVDLAVEARRLATFATWPLAHPLKPDDLAAAGFFYIGGQESVKCFYCGVVVSTWPTDSDAWVEHAKRSSSCLFLEQVKGFDFVQQHRIVNSRADGSSPQPHLRVDPREVRARIDSPKVQILLQMEYPVDLVREAIQKRLATVSDDHVSSEDLLSSMFDLHDERQRTQLEAVAGRPARSAALPVVVAPVGYRSAAVTVAAALPHSSSVPALPTGAESASVRHLSAAEVAPSLSSSLPALLSNAELQQPLPLAGAGQHFTPLTWKPPGAEGETQTLFTSSLYKLMCRFYVWILSPTSFTFSS